MSHKITYSCDRCKKESPDRKELKCVTAMVGQFSGDSSAELTRRGDWCFDCLRELGIIPPEFKETAKNDNPEITLEGLIREIVRQEVGR